MGGKTLDATKRHVKGAGQRLAGKSHKLASVLKNRGKLAKIVRISPVDLVLAGIDLTMVFTDSFKAGKKNAKIAG